MAHSVIQLSSREEIERDDLAICVMSRRRARNSCSVVETVTYLLIKRVNRAYVKMAYAYCRTACVYHLSCGPTGAILVRRIRLHSPCCVINSTIQYFR